MGATNGISIDQSTVESEAANISSAASYFQSEQLSPVDSETTLTANSGGKDAFQGAQSLVAELGSAINQDAANIRSLGTSFTEFDQMMATLNQSK